MPTTIKDLDVQFSPEELAWIIRELPQNDGTTDRLKKILTQHVARELGIT